MSVDDATVSEDATSDVTPEQNPADVVTYWTAQLAAYDDEFKDWTTRAKKIIRRYRDERSEKSDGTLTGGTRFNSLWSNVQTLQPATYIKSPQPVVERRYRAKDPMARLASMTLERACEVQVDVGKFHPAMQKAVLDYFLCGRGTMWERYEPTYGEAKDLSEGQPDADKSTDGKQSPGEAPRPVTYEKVMTDYVAWDKFKHSPASTWDDVWWVAKEEMLTRAELRSRFKGKDAASGKALADLIPLRDGSKDKENDREKKRRNPRACVVEIWNKRDRKVIFIAPDYQNAPLEVGDDPLSLDQFWPCPAPLFATMTNDSLVPVPDYVEYQDQAEELDNLTNRIRALTDAIRVNGVYDASIPELKRILSEGVDNRMIGVKNYKELVSKGGLDTALMFVPIKDIVEALLRLYEARDRVKADMAEITGLSDIVRGQAQGTAKTATEQRIKGQFTALRLEDRKKEVSRFARDAIALKAEIISEQFSPDIIAEQTGMIPFIADEIKADMDAAPPPMPPPSPMIGHNGGPPMAPPGVSPPPGLGAPGGAGLPPAAGPPPMNGAQMPMAGMMPPPPPDPMELAHAKFQQVCDLLKNDKLRTFRIDIETDSTVEPDKQASKEAASEAMTALGGFLEKALPIGQAMPKLTPALGQTMLWLMRTFNAARDVESVWEQAIDDMTKMAKNPPPPPPSPEMIKAQAAQQQAELNMQAQQQDMANKQKLAEMDLQGKQAEHQMNLEKMQAEVQIEQQRLQIERERLSMKSLEHQMDLAAHAHQAQIDGVARERQAQIDEESSTRAAEQGERGHELEMETMEAQAAAKQKAARQPAGASA